MANRLPKTVSAEVRDLTYSKCDEYGYTTRSRIENNSFMNSLVESPEIGGRLRDYMTGEEVRTYIKDTLLNAYAKLKVKDKIKSASPDAVIKAIYDDTATLISKHEDTSICRSLTGTFYIIQAGTLLKWETALRKILEYIVRTPVFSSRESNLEMCLVLAVTNDELTYGDQQQIESALGYIGVKVYFAR